MKTKLAASITLALLTFAPLLTQAEVIHQVPPGPGEIKAYPRRVGAETVNQPVVPTVVDDHILDVTERADHCDSVHRASVNVVRCKPA